MSTGVINTSPPVPTGVEKAVDREMRRQRLLSLLFTVLLIVPVVVGVAFVAFGRTDRQVVRDEVEQRVAPLDAATREIVPALAEVKNAASLVQQQRVAMVEQQQRIDDLVGAQERLELRMRPGIGGDVSAEQVQELTNRVAALREELDEHRRRFDTMMQAQERIIGDQHKINGELLSIRKRIDRMPVERPE
jgi:DNA repair exonuclease SbcCD ATPase subunit